MFLATTESHAYYTELQLPTKMYDLTLHNVNVIMETTSKSPTRITKRDLTAFAEREP